MIASIKFAHSKNPKPGQPSKYAMFDLEDMSGMIRSIVWPSDFANIGQHVQADAVLGVRGTIDKRPGSEEANFYESTPPAIRRTPRGRFLQNA